MTETIALIDRGRGLQLSTSRITVMDLVQYFRGGCSPDVIRRWIPSLSYDEIAVVEEYYHNHKSELDAADERLNARRTDQIRLQRERFPETSETPEQRMERWRSRLRQLQEEQCGEGAPR